MTSSPKRPWFRFHLLTTVVMTIAAGGIVWVNAHSHLSYFHAGQYVVICYGVPFPFVQIFQRSWTKFGKDVFIGVTVLCAVGFIAEWLILFHRVVRRRP